MTSVPRIITDLESGKELFLVPLTEEQAFSLAELVNNSPYLRDHKESAVDAWGKLIRAGGILRRNREEACNA